MGLKKIFSLNRDYKFAWFTVQTIGYTSSIFTSPNWIHIIIKPPVVYDRFLIAATLA